MDSSPDAAQELPAYAELHCQSNYSFLTGASFPDELVARGAELGYSAIAITDECSLSGMVRAHVEAKARNIPLIIGSQLQLTDGLRLVLLATDRNSYGCLSHLITVARRQAAKGDYRLDRETLQSNYPSGCLALWLPDYPNPDAAQLSWLVTQFPQRLWIAVELLLAGDDQAKLEQLGKLGQDHDVPLCASGDVHMHVRQRRMLQDTLTAIRLGKPLRELGLALFPNAERHLRSRKRLARIYPPALLQETTRIAERCRFSLDELRYEYPDELIPTAYTAHDWLRHLTEQGIQRRWPDKVPEHIHQLIEQELALIKALNYEPYFLTVYDIVRYAREQGILCQGRGSAANSAICFCLGITEVDPARMELLFERFISKERNEPPDIDVDFEHERREEVIQYIYRRYGRDRAALAATVITYQPRSAVRDVGKALGLSLDQVDRLAKSIQWWDKTPFAEEQLKAMGFAINNEMISRLLYLVREIVGFPRHLSQHVGGFVISRGALSHLVPIENASMAERTVIQWEKNDLEALGLLKIDVLALGMLTAIRKALALISESIGKPFTLADIPAEDPAVYAMIQRADTIGVFQIESRAQMTMLPRLKPENYYDLVIEIAIIRPGPIQGDMVHPYLRRRKGQEPVSYPSKAVEKVLQRTLGVPIFQEQVMQLAMVAAGFSAGEADQLRRCMATWKRRGGLEQFEHKLLDGMQSRGYPRSFAEQIFNQIKGFGEYGFPESHSASFALLAYASSWLKCYHPAAFTCALLNSQPMGFYAPAQLIQDAKRHGVKVLAVDVNQSAYDCTLVYARKHGVPALRLGLRIVKGLSKSAAERLVVTRQQSLYADIQDLAQRTAMNQADMQSLAAADAFRALSGNRYRAFWDVAGTETALPLFDKPNFAEGDALLPTPNEAQDIVADYQSTGLTLRRHPLALLREQLEQRGVCTAAQLYELEDGTHTSVAGLVIGRQRPGTASGVIFVTLEDETGYANIVVWPKVGDRYRQALLGARLLIVRGTVQQEEGVLHLIAQRLEDFSMPLGGLRPHSRDFC